MTTTTLSSSSLFTHKQALSYNKLSVLSFVLSLSFVTYFLALAANILLFHSFLRFSLLFIVLAPICAAALALMSLRQINQTHENGSVLSYIALSISALYFTVALSIGFVLIGLYLLYVFIL